MGGKGYESDLGGRSNRRVVSARWSLEPGGPRFDNWEPLDVPVSYMAQQRLREALCRFPGGALLQHYYLCRASASASQPRRSLSDGMLDR
jgi:hypothetical protein